MLHLFGQLLKLSTEILAQLSYCSGITKRVFILYVNRSY